MALDGTSNIHGEDYTRLRYTKLSNGVAILFYNLLYMIYKTQIYRVLIISVQFCGTYLCNYINLFTHLNYICSYIVKHLVSPSE